LARKEHDRKTKWEPPPAGWVKLNVDGSFVQQSGESGVGVIARDNEGHVIFSAWRAIFNCQDAAEAEAWACLEGLRLAAQWIHEPVIVESDCARIVPSSAGRGRSIRAQLHPAGGQGSSADATSMANSQGKTRV